MIVLKSFDFYQRRSMPRRWWKYRITDILDSINKIQNYVAEMEFDGFKKDEKIIGAFIRNIRTAYLSTRIP